MEVELQSTIGIWLFETHTSQLFSHDIHWVSQWSLSKTSQNMFLLFRLGQGIMLTWALRHAGPKTCCVKPYPTHNKYLHAKDRFYGCPFFLAKLTETSNATTCHQILLHSITVPYFLALKVKSSSRAILRILTSNHLYKKFCDSGYCWVFKIFACKFIVLLIRNCHVLGKDFCILPNFTQGLCWWHCLKQLKEH